MQLRDGHFLPGNSAFLSNKGECVCTTLKSKNTGMSVVTGTCTMSYNVPHLIVVVIIFISFMYIRLEKMRTKE